MVSGNVQLSRISRRPKPRYLPKDHDELDPVARAKAGDSEIEVFTPVEMAEILPHADEGLIPFLTLGAFAGVRHAEIQRLDWRDIQFDAGIIEIRAKIVSRKPDGSGQKAEKGQESAVRGQESEDRAKAA